MSDEQRKTYVLLEQLLSQFRTFGECLDSIHDEFKEFKQAMIDFKKDTTTQN